MKFAKRFSLVSICVLSFLTFTTPPARADAVVDWNVRACTILSDANMDAPPSNRVMAIAHTAVYEAVNAITKRYPQSGLGVKAPAGASVDAAVAAANHVVLLK